MVMVQTTLEGARVEVQRVIIDLKDMKKQAAMLTATLYGTLGILRRLGLPEEVNQAMMMAQRMISTFNMLRLSAIALNMSLGPLGWVLAGIGIVGSALTFGDFMMDVF